jgi:ABC-type Mn2+/Zn2+ transport system permease subunit
MDWLVTPFEPSFMQRALIAGLLVGTTSAVIGTWVVVRGLSFMGDALAHGVLPGIAVAFLWGFSTLIGAFIGAVVMVAGINIVHRRSNLSDDTGIGLLFVGMLALGVVIVSRSATFTTSLTAFLFGDILGVRPADLAPQAIAAVAVLSGSIVAHRPFVALALDHQKAEALGMRPRLAHTFMLGLVAIAIIASFKAVGTLLVFGLLVGPPATSALVTKRIPTMMLASGLLSAIAVVLGLAFSFHFDTAAAASISGLSVVVFFVVLGARDARRALRKLHVPSGHSAPL